MISSFSGKYGFLSNFHECPFTDSEGLIYKTNEHYFQAQKMAHKADRLEVINASNPQLAKIIGRGRKMRSDWESVKDGVMLVGLRLKFKDPVLREKLLATNEEVLVEGNMWHDCEWGFCTCVKCCGKEKKNKLGQLLMKVRGEIRNEQEKETIGI